MNNSKEKYRVVFHGVHEKETADKILETGFKKGTYFARHLEDAICYGGRYVFYVVLKVTGGDWEIIAKRHIPPTRITQLACFNPKEIYYNPEARYKFFGKGRKCPCSNCGENIGNIRLSILGKPAIAKCPKCGLKFN